MNPSWYYQNFQEISCIGKGTFGTVYKAKNRLDCTEYAIKTIVFPSKEKKRIIDCLNEARALAKLHHQNIVPYKTVWIEEKQKFNSADEDQTIIYIQMMLCKETLREWINNRGQASLLEISHIFIQILRGVSYIHKENILHNDIKLDNIFISSRGPSLQIRLGDFGLCNYRYCNTKSDMRDVGTVFTEILFRTHTKEDLEDTIQTLQDDDNILKSLPSDQRKWAQVIMQLVQKDPQNRPEAEQVLQKAKDLNIDKDETIKLKITTLEDDNKDKDHKIEKPISEIALLGVGLRDSGCTNLFGSTFTIAVFLVLLAIIIFIVYTVLTNKSRNSTKTNYTSTRTEKTTVKIRE